MNSPTPTFSVVVPVFNKEPHIARVFDSCLSQTYEDFELLAIDDASTDNSRRDIEKFDDPRIRILERTTPGPGGYAARNLGIAEARGQWIAFVDADDEWTPSHLESLFAVSQQFPDCDFLTCGWTVVKPDGSSHENKYFRHKHSQGAHTLSFADYLTACVDGMRPTHTSVACIRNIDIAKELFPAGRASRGGDLHAWLSYLARSRDMAWSPTIGGKYYRDAVNQVTRSVPRSPALALAIVDEISPYLEADEVRLLKKYNNRRVFDSWLKQKQNNEEPLKLASSMHWREDFSFCLTRSALSVVPFKLVTRLYKQWRSLSSG